MFFKTVFTRSAKIFLMTSGKCLQQKFANFQVKETMMRELNHPKSRKNLSTFFGELIDIQDMK